MAQKKTRPAPQIRAGKFPTEPLNLNPAHVRDVGVLRATYDAVRIHPVVTAYRLAAKNDPTKRAEVNHKCAKLAEATARANAHLEDPAPF